MNKLKKGAGQRLQEFKKSSAERKKFNRELNQEMLEVRRKLFKKEAVRQAGLSARYAAKQRFGVKKQVPLQPLSFDTASMLGFGKPVMPLMMPKKRKKKKLHKPGTVKEVWYY